MDVDIKVLVEITLKTQQLPSRTDIRHSRLSRFLHDITEFASYRELSFTGDNRDFNGEQVTPTSVHARPVATPTESFSRHAVVVASRPKKILEVFRLHGNDFLLPVTKRCAALRLIRAISRSRLRTPASRV